MECDIYLIYEDSLGNGFHNIRFELCFNCPSYEIIPTCIRLIAMRRGESIPKIAYSPIHYLLHGFEN